MLSEDIIEVNSIGFDRDISYVNFGGSELMRDHSAQFEVAP